MREKGGGGKLLATNCIFSSYEGFGLPICLPAHTSSSLATLAGTAREVEVASAQTKWMSALGLMYKDAQVVELLKAFLGISRSAQVAAGELVVGCAALV